MAARLEALCQIREKVTAQFWSKWPPSAKRAKFDLTDLEKWPLERFNQIYLLICDLCHPKEKKLHAKKEEKLLKCFWDRPLPPSILTDGRTDRRTTDKSVLEKLHCLSAGGAKKLKNRFWDWPFPPPPPLKLTTMTTTDESAFEKLRCQVAQRS